MAKILSTGTVRVNRGVPPACRQPEKVKLKKKELEALNALKESDPAQVLKARMTVHPARVLCVSYFDNAPVHMFSTIHERAGFVTLSSRRWDASQRKHVQVPVQRVEAIHDYNQNMNNVDRFDQISNGYNLDGMGWRDRKWWHAVFKCFLKASVDQAYILYKRQFEIEKEAKIAAAVANATAADLSRTTGSPSGNTRRCALPPPHPSPPLARARGRGGS